MKYLRLKYDMHMLLNERAELEEQKSIRSVDISKVHKVDNHIHSSCSMTQTHLIDFIKRKLDQSGDMVVVKNYRNSNQPATLKTIFQDLDLKRDELNLDQMGIRAV
jgi:AMP deaminase